MRKAKRLAAIVGVIGGLLWFLSALHFPPQYYPLGLGPLPPQILPLGILLSLMGIVGGILALGRPAVGGTLMLASAVGGFFGPFALAWFFWEDVWRGIALSTVIGALSWFPGSDCRGKRCPSPGYLEQTLQSQSSDSGFGGRRWIYQC